MSGGSFKYAFYHVQEFADELKNQLEDQAVQVTYGAEVRAILAGIVKQAGHMAQLMKETEWLFSGDTSEETFLARVAEAKDEYGQEN